MKKFLPHLIALGVFIIITFIYCMPLLDGKELRQSDTNNWKGMSKEILDYRDKNGESTLWTNSMFGGMPAYQISVVYAANLVQYIDKLVTLGLPLPANYLFLLMAGFYFLLVVMKVDNKVAILGAVAFAFSSYFIIYIVTGHNSKAHALGYMAPVIASIILTYRGKLFLGSVLATLFLAIELYTNHLQITYYLMLMVVLLVAAELYSAYKEKRVSYFVKASVLLGAGAILAVCTNITNLWATQEYGKYSTRGPSELTADKANQTSGLPRDYITDWSFEKSETTTLLIPDFKGGASEPIGKNNKDALQGIDSNFKSIISSFGAYYGEQIFTGGPVYLGAIVVLLFFIGLFTVKGPIKWWLFGATVLSITLSWGKNFMVLTNLFLDFVPGYDKFRAVTTTIVIAEFAVPVLAALAIDQMIRNKDFFQQNKKRLMYSAGGLMLVVLLITVNPSMFTNFYTDNEYNRVSEQVKGQPNASETLDAFFSALTEARTHILKSDSTRSLVFMLLAAALIYTFLRFRYKKEIFIYSLIALILIDLMSVDRRYMSSEDWVKKSANVIPFPKSQADDMIHQDTTKSYRVLNLAVDIFNDASTSYYHQSIGGYHGAKLKRYKELIDYNLMSEITTMRNVMQKPDAVSEQILYQQPAINMMNTKFIIYNPEAPPLVNKGALGNAWFVSEIKVVANSDSEIAAIHRFNPRELAVIDERYKDKLSGFTASKDSTASIVLTSYKPNDLKYSSTTASEQLAVFSEIFYDKGWNAYIDGKPADYVRANYVLRAMRIPAGTHSIEFKFEPNVYKTGERISFAGSLCIILLSVFALYKEVRSGEKGPETKPGQKG